MPEKIKPRIVNEYLAYYTIRVSRNRCVVVRKATIVFDAAFKKMLKAWREDG